MNILITSIGTTTAINLYKLLRTQHRIIGTDINPKGHTAGSLLVNIFEQVPPYNSPYFLSNIKNIVTKYSVDLIIPIHDYEIKVLSQSDITKYTKVIMPPIETIEIFSDKLISINAMNKLGIFSGQIITSQHYNKKIIRRERIGVGSKGIQIFEDNLTAKQYILPSYANSSYFLQEFIDGEEYTVDVACDSKGIPFLIIPRKRIEVKAGVATKVQIVNDRNLIQKVQSIYTHFNIPGFSNVQFILSNNQYYFIELNYRYGGMSISSALATYNYAEEVVDYYINDSGNKHKTINDFPIKWNAFITRYFEELISYEA